MKKNQNMVENMKTCLKLGMHPINFVDEECDRQLGLGCADIELKY